MTNRSWKTLFLLLSTLLCYSTSASGYSSPTLNEASLLLDIDPREAQSLVTAFLTQRRLIDTTEKTPSTITRDETEHKIRTPGASVEALGILAQAQSHLGHQTQAMDYIRQAKVLANKYQLIYLDIDVRLLEIKLNWLFDRNKSRARQQIARIETRLDQMKNTSQLIQRIRYKILMLQAEIASRSDENQLAEKLYKHAKDYFSSIQAVTTQIKYHIEFGKHFLSHGQYNKALSELLTAYWSALEADDGAQLAATNSLLARLFFERRVLDKALLYLSQAADFYDNYERSPVWVNIMQRMGDIYFRQGKYNLALVSYLNVLDHPVTQHSKAQFISVRINLAATYLQLYNYPLAEDYLEAIDPLLKQNDFPGLQGKAALLKAVIAYVQKQPSLAIQLGLKSEQLTEITHDHHTNLQALKLLSNAYEQQGNYKKALYYAHRHYQQNESRQQKLNQLSEDDFKQQKAFVEQTLHLEGLDRELKRQKNRYSSLKNISYSIAIISFVFFLVILRRGYIIRHQNEEIEELNNHLFTHSRSQLNNLRMLNVNLSSTLMQKRNQVYEQWYMGELIHKPLNDKLRFAMIDVPFLRNMYLQHGYSEGLKLELAFGKFLKEKLSSNARIFHFTDANLLYIENNQEQDTQPQALFDRIQTWVNEFQSSVPLNRIIRIGIADYPFLPKAHTAINEKELLDILLMATSASRDLSIKEKSSHWVYLKAIDNTPAASFASDNIREACQQAISQGLVKVHSSYNNEESIQNLLNVNETP
ncbi:tetratricopeptide repeat protein [Vibrio aerogenes]|uniref:tetratricopeptide repeat protein n=1 Tax=Vibrio aerogenes TaxID=92172 RepID=UPI0039EF5EDC